VNDLCSPEARKEVELHLKDCPECEKKLQNYRVKLKSELQSSEEDSLENQSAEIDPMKKVKKKMKKGKRKVVALGIILVLVLGVLGVLSYGEATNLYPGFTVISDTMKIKSACKALTRGEIQPFIDLLAYRMEDQYVLRSTGAFEDMDVYMEKVHAQVEEAYKYYFEGKNVRIELTETELTPYDSMQTADMRPTSILVSFYEGDVLLRSMYFDKVSRNHFTVYEDSGAVTDDPLKPSFTGGMIPYDGIVYNIALQYSMRTGYDDLVSGEKKTMGEGLVLVVEKADENENEVFTGQMKEKMEQLVERGCYIKNVSHSISGYDEESGRWVNTVWITYEDQHTGAIFITEQNFIAHNNRLYVMEGNQAVVTSISSEENVPTEAIEIALTMFQ